MILTLPVSGWVATASGISYPTEQRGVVREPKAAILSEDDLQKAPSCAKDISYSMDIVYIVWPSYTRTCRPRSPGSTMR